jgi:hypothetical protein
MKNDFTARGCGGLDKREMLRPRRRVLGLRTSGEEAILGSSISLSDSLIY